MAGFVNQWLRWGDAPELRWATNNAKLIRHGRKPGKEDDADMGNYVYGKIEGKAENRPIYGICSGDDCGKRAAAETGKTNTENTGLQLLRG